jgi:hypothetical protein
MQNPLAHTIAEACARSSIGRTAIYELINTGQLPARKHASIGPQLEEYLVRIIAQLFPFIIFCVFTGILPANHERKTTMQNSATGIYRTTIRRIFGPNNRSTVSIYNLLRVHRHPAGQPRRNTMDYPLAHTIAEACALNPELICKKENVS